MKVRMLCVGCLGLYLPAFALQALEVQVTDQSGQGLEGAVVFVVARDGIPLTADAETLDPVVIDQRDKEFIPTMTALTVGSAVAFPNNDRIRHQVYSFSEAKSFEIPLYAGAPAAPVTFEQSGVVTLGCNIHDWMQAYVFVSASSHYALTDANGQARLEGLEPARYAIQVWHPTLKGEAHETEQQVSTADGDRLHFAVATRQVWHAFRSPTGVGLGGYK